jgi:hypothetical protein
MQNIPEAGSLDVVVVGVVVVVVVGVGGGGGGGGDGGWRSRKIILRIPCKELVSTISSD